MFCTQQYAEELTPSFHSNNVLRGPSVRHPPMLATKWFSCPSVPKILSFNRRQSVSLARSAI
ncbi:hypothetical protein BpHYR1_031432 [Brachionus plicatilis]|uniref:Uncharacterized protein n=1 Tax=Brachionus plicatilis TaxID=10195 RepID=A0A3M7RAZ1_BRAPC|nr:hypothetical protein BpHYR1_031432 [Brachionus plicatilis]